MDHMFYEMGHVLFYNFQMEFSTSDHCDIRLRLELRKSKLLSLLVGFNAPPPGRATLHASAGAGASAAALGPTKQQAAELLSVGLACLKLLST